MKIQSYMMKYKKQFPLHWNLKTFMKHYRISVVINSTWHLKNRNYSLSFINIKYSSISLITKLEIHYWGKSSVYRTTSSFKLDWNTSWRLWPQVHAFISTQFTLLFLWALTFIHFQLWKAAAALSDLEVNLHKMAVQTLFNNVSCCPAAVMVWTPSFAAKGRESRSLPLLAWSSRQGRSRSLCHWCNPSNSHTLRPQCTLHGYSNSDFCLPHPGRSNTPQSSHDSCMLKEKGSVSKYFPTGDAPLLLRY